MPLILAWPFRMGGIQRGGEAPRVGFPGGGNGLGKGQEVRMQRAGVGARLLLFMPSRGPSLLPSLGFPRPLPD